MTPANWAVKAAKFVGTKFTLTLLTLILSFILALKDKELLAWAGVITPILAFYLGANVYQKQILLKNGKDVQE